MAKRKQHLHEKRKVKLSELIALLGVRDALKRGVIKMHSPNNRYGDADAGLHVFNMAIPMSKSEHCGSLGCIGGYMAQALNLDGGDYVGDQLGNGMRSASLVALFYPPSRYDYRKITPAHAVKAIDNWLETGKPKWGTILPDSALESFAR